LFWSFMNRQVCVLSVLCVLSVPCAPLANARTGTHDVVDGVVDEVSNDVVDAGVDEFDDGGTRKEGLDGARVDEDDGRSMRRGTGENDDEDDGRAPTSRRALC